MTGSLWSSVSAAARLRELWGEERSGLVLLSLGTAATFILGLALQVLGLRSLSGGDYATFVFALAIGNIASAIASAIQPVVTTRTQSGEPSFLPAAPGTVVIGVAVGLAAAVALTSRAAGPAVAALAVLQVPLHAVVAVGQGRLQAARSFRWLAVALVVWAVARMAVVLLCIAAGRGTAAAFVLALPAALLVELLLLARLGAFRGIDRRAAADGRRLLENYLCWALFAWLLNADAVYARLWLAPEPADQYAVAFTLGRQPIYAVAPLAMVLLPVSHAARLEDQRGRLRAILLVSVGLLVGTVLVLGIRPRSVVALLAGDAAGAAPALIRGYAVVGPLAAAATLLMTLAFAVGRAPGPRALAGIAAVGAVAAAATRAPGPLLLMQAGVVAVAAVCAYRGARA
jgi:O-antigen/teichoic acid export membrane protein